MACSQVGMSVSSEIRALTDSGRQGEAEDTSRIYDYSCAGLLSLTMYTQYFGLKENPFVLSRIHAISI